MSEEFEKVYQQYLDESDPDAPPTSSCDLFEWFFQAGRALGRRGIVQELYDVRHEPDKMLCLIERHYAAIRKELTNG